MVGSIVVWFSMKRKTNCEHNPTDSDFERRSWYYVIIIIIIIRSIIMVSAMSVLEKIRNPRLDRRPKKVTESDGTGKRSSEFDSFRGCSWLSRGNYFPSTLTLDHQLFPEIIKRLEF